MSSRLLAVTFDAQDPDRVARFWAGLLDRNVLVDADGVLLPADGTTQQRLTAYLDHASESATPGGAS